MFSIDKLQSLLCRIYMSSEIMSTQSQPSEDCDDQRVAADILIAFCYKATNKG